MLNFLKKLFKSEEKEKVAIKLPELESWFSKNSKNFVDNINNKLNGFIEKINDEKEITISNIEKLKTTELQNPKIPIREKQFMEGNRDAYIKRVEVFLKRLSFENHKELKEFSFSFNKELETFGKSTLKAYQVLQHFFANETRNLAINIKNFENIFKELREFFSKNNAEDIEKIKDDIDSLKKGITNKKNFKEESDKKSSLIKKLNDDKKNIEKKIKELRESKEFNELNGLLEDKKSIDNKIIDHRNNLTQLFSVLEHSLKKYVRMVFEDEKLLKRYIENPFDALLSDKELKIIKILSGLGKNIENDSIELKDKKKGKTLEAIKTLDNQFFNKFIDEHKALDNKLELIDEKIKQSKVQEKEEEFSNKLNIAKINIDKTNKDITNLKKEIEKMDIEKIKNNLQKEIHDKLKVDIVIS